MLGKEASSTIFKVFGITQNGIKPWSPGLLANTLPTRPMDWYSNIYRGCPRGVMVKAMDCGIVVREFVLQSRYYVHFWANNLGKGMNPLILLAMG